MDSVVAVLERYRGKSHEIWPKDHDNSDRITGRMEEYIRIIVEQWM
jgi:hypothetical protein